MELFCKMQSAQEDPNNFTLKGFPNWITDK